MLAQGRENQRRKDWPLMDLLFYRENLANMLLSMHLEWCIFDAMTSVHVW